jgi:hypothetical protein
MEKDLFRKRLYLVAFLIRVYYVKYPRQGIGFEEEGKYLARPRCIQNTQKHLDE